jgi:hypothetical protein
MSKVELILMYKPDGSEIKINENSYLHAIDIGWTDKKPSTRKDKKKSE